jgi:hypothetical protein
VDDQLPTQWEEWALMGFAVVELSGRDAHVRYVDEFGGTYAEEQIAASRRSPAL